MNSARVKVRARSLRTLRRAFLGVRSGTTRAQAIDFVGAEAQLSEDFPIMLAKRWGTLCRHFGDAMHLNRAADRRGELAARPFERNDDVIGAQLRIVDHLLRLAYNTTGFDLPERRMISAVPQPTIFSASGAAPTPLYHEYQEHFGLTAFMITIIFAA
jgi:hypothetical protein